MAWWPVRLLGESSNIAATQFLTKGEPMKFLLAGSSFMAGLCVGAAILLPTPANAAEYTAVGRDSSGEMVLVEFDSTYNAEPEAEE